MRRVSAVTSFSLFLLALGCVSVPPTAERNDAGTGAASFGEFDRRARAGERLSVVFFGASLTWGANASDPNLTSYRALVADRLRERYPEAHFRFWDAAIGGTNSQLGVFRLERDVLRRKPALVFLDFSANDDIYTADPERLASYEAIVRRLVVEARCPVVQVIFPFKWNVAQGTTDGMKRRDAHLAIAASYSVPVGDAIALAIRRVREKRTTLAELWPVDGVHPCDAGYVLFADAAWQAFEAAVRARQVCRAPGRMLNADTYMRSLRFRLATLDPLPVGWRVGPPNVNSAFFDFLMSRWQDEQAVASNRTVVRGRDGKSRAEAQKVEPLEVVVRGRTILLFGETTKKSGKYRVRLDGKVLDLVSPSLKEPAPISDAGAFARRIGGNGHYVQVLATGLDPQETYTLRIEPLLSSDEEQELRIESLCVAGGEPSIRPADARGQ